jgi:glycoside/pentoside/hexuronide:cation symporter, GPH family
VTEIAAAPRLSFGVKVSYGLGAVAQGVGGVALSTTTITFYLVGVVGMRPGLVGLVIMLSLIVDAVVDPAIGRFSDTFRSGWGRRHPFMYASVVPIGLATVLLWWRPPGLSGDAMATYILVTLVALRLAGGLYTIPSDALTPELAPDYHERTTLIAYRWFFGLAAAAVLGVLLGVVFLRQDKSHPLGQYDPHAYFAFGVTAAIIACASILVSALATHRYIPRLSRAPARTQSFAEAAREIAAVLSNRSLLAVMASGLISGVAGGVSATLTSFMNYYFWGLSPQQAALIGFLAAPAAILGIVVAPFASRALDKKRTMLTVFGLSIFTGVIPVALRLLGLAPPNGSPWIIVILAADLMVAGALGLMGFVIIGSMVSDVVEDSAVKSGVRSEGLLFAANGLLPKVTTGLGSLVGGLMLEAVHFHVRVGPGGSHTVDPATMHNLALMAMPAGALLNSLAVAVLGFYRIDRGSHEANLEALRMATMVGDPPSLPGGGPLVEPDVFSPKV